MNEFYSIEALPSTHVLGRAARVIVVTPKDQFRFGYRLWLDESSAMPLKTQLCDSHGQVIEQILFARLDMPETIADSELTPAVRTDGMHWVRQGPSTDSASPALSAYRASALPPGFHLTVAGAQTLGDASVPASHLVYSDGLATVSVFVEAQRDERSSTDEKPEAVADPPLQGLAKVGSGFAVLDRRPGPSSDGSRRSAGADGGIHRPFGQVVERRPAAPALIPAPLRLRGLFARGMRSVR